MNRWQQGLALANAERKQRRSQHIDQILKTAAVSGAITNYQVQKMFRCSQLTAYRYLRALEKEGKLRRTGGHNTPTYKPV